MASDELILRTSDLRMSYGRGLFRKGFEAIRGVSLEVGRGSVFGLLGPNGAGKTTLVKVLLGLVRGHRGSATLFGRPAGDPRARRRVGFLPEAHRLPQYLTGRQALRLFGMMSGRPRRWIDERMEGWLDVVGMTDSADRKIREYSKGMQQRIGLVQAFLHEPELVFLDEPTDGVDPVGRAAIRRVVQDLRGKGVTVFINSHLLAEVEMVCDRAMIMIGGRIAKEGTMDELTPETGRIHFRLDAMPGDLEGLLAGVGSGLQARSERAREGAAAEPGFDLVLRGDEIDAVVDRLRGAGVGIRGISQPRLSLEQTFIDLVQKEGE